MKTAKTCIICGALTTRSRCRQHAIKRGRPQSRLRAIVLTEENTCWICGQPGKTDDPLTLDHIVPLSRGGAQNRANVRAAHSSCNKRRGAKMPESYTSDMLSATPPPTPPNQPRRTATELYREKRVLAGLARQSAKHAERKKRAAKAADLWLAGHNWTRIGRILGVAVSRIMADVKQHEPSVIVHRGGGRIHIRGATKNL